MNGSVYLGGGGSPSDEREVWRSAYLGVQRVLYWPFALPDDIVDTADEWFRRALATLEVTADVTTWSSLAGRNVGDLADFDLLHVGGGNTFTLLDKIRRHGFVDPVRAFVNHGGAYYGGSAGAVIACDDIAVAAPHDPNTVGLTDLTALGLVPRYSVLPHYDGSAEQALTWTRQQRRPLLAIPERAGICFDGTTFTAIGPEPSTEFDQHGSTHRPAGRSWIHPRY